jgi:uncharacterized protein YjbI with pentapeptide repeats
MDHERFDAITRLAWTTSSRRTVLGLLLGAALHGRDVDSAAGKPLAGRKGKKTQTQTSSKQRSGDRRCYPGTSCIPGPGRDNTGCDFSFSTLFRDKNAQGSQLGKSNFRGADLRGANFQGANLAGACFVSANLEGAKLGASVNLHKAIFCNTIMPDGSVDDSGCAKTTACCPPLVQDCPTVDIDCYTTDSQNVCLQPVNGFPSVAHCGRGLACCPCDHPDVDYWTAQCNQTYPACEGKCKAVDGGTFLECWSGCIL